MENKLLYGVLDDCYVSIFSDDYIDHPRLSSFVDISAKYLDANFDWSKKSTRKLWRKEIRNNKYQIENSTIGYGAIDGRLGFQDYLQLGEENLVNNDLICLYTDGFINLIKNIDFIKYIRTNDFNEYTKEYIRQTCYKLNARKEKTCYLIKYNSY